MIPRADVEVSPDLPAGAAYWVPTEEDLSEEGVGYFRDTWLIMNVSAEEAEEIVSYEEQMLRVVDELAANPQDFEELAKCVEWSDVEAINALPEGVKRRHGFASFRNMIPIDDFSVLQGLDFGVSGLAHALASVGVVPAASCRGHIGSSAWAHHPVVFFAADRFHAEKLAPFVREVGSGFLIDSARPQLLCVYSASIEDTISLARLVLDRHHEFGEKTCLRRLMKDQ